MFSNILFHLPLRPQRGAERNQCQVTDAAEKGTPSRHQVKAQALLKHLHPRLEKALYMQ